MVITIRILLPQTKTRIHASSSSSSDRRARQSSTQSHSWPPRNNNKRARERGRSRPHGGGGVKIDEYEPLKNVRYYLQPFIARERERCETKAKGKKTLDREADIVDLGSLSLSLSLSFSLRASEFAVIIALALYYKKK